MVVIFVTRPLDTGSLSKAKGPMKRKYSSLFSTQFSAINFANFSNYCNITLSVMVVIQRDIQTAGGMLVPTAYRRSEYWN